MHFSKPLHFFLFSAYLHFSFNRSADMQLMSDLFINQHTIFSRSLCTCTLPGCWMGISTVDDQYISTFQNLWRSLNEDPSSDFYEWYITNGFLNQLCFLWFIGIGYLQILCATLVAKKPFISLDLCDPHVCL